MTLEDLERGERDADYLAWADDEYHRGNPADSESRDAAIDWFAERYPETSALEKEQAEFSQQAYANEPRLSFHEYEGPRFTEPPLNWVTAGEHGGWTFTQWGLARGYDSERVEEVNREFPPDRTEIEAGAQCAQDCEAEYWRQGYEPEPEPQNTGLLRIVPMGREVRDELNPYADGTPWTIHALREQLRRNAEYWAPGIEPER